MDLSSVLDKKVGDFNKKGIWKPYKLRAGDSERLSQCLEVAYDTNGTTEEG